MDNTVLADMFTKRGKLQKSKSGGRVSTIEEDEEGPRETIVEAASSHTKAPVKKRRGADGEIAQACFSYANGEEAKNLRPRKEVPAYRQVELAKDDDYKIVGKRVQVYWPESKRWFAGRIMSFERRKKLHSILYKDGDREELNLRKERFMLGVLPSEDFKLKVEPKSRKKTEAVVGSSMGADAMETGSPHASDADSVSGISMRQYKRRPKKVADQRSSELKRRSSDLMKQGHANSDAGVDEVSEKSRRGPAKPLKKRRISKGEATLSRENRKKVDLASRKTSQEEDRRDAQLEVHAQDGANSNTVQEGGLNAKEASEDDHAKGIQKTEAPKATARKGGKQIKRAEADDQNLDSASSRKNGDEVASTRSKEVSSDLQTAALECPAGTLPVEHGAVTAERGGECRRDKEILTFVRRKRRHA